MRKKFMTLLVSSFRYLFSLKIPTTEAISKNLLSSPHTFCLAYICLKNINFKQTFSLFLLILSLRPYGYFLFFDFIVNIHIVSLDLLTFDHLGPLFPYLPYLFFEPFQLFGSCAFSLCSNHI